MTLLSTSRDRLLLAALGTVQGLVYYLYTGLEPGTAVGQASLASLLALVTVGGLSASYTWTGQGRRRWLSMVLGVAALFAAITCWVWLQIPVYYTTFAGDELRGWTWALAAAMALYILLPFMQITQCTGRLAFPYHDLFHHSWNNAFIGLIAVLCMGVFWLLLVLWAQLFAVIGIAFFKTLFYHKAFVWISLLTAWGYGLAIGKENAAIIATLRRITLTIFHLFMPLLAIVALLFLLVLPVTGLQPLWDTKHAASLLLALLALTILFINAVFQDGTEPAAYPLWVRRGIEGALLAMPVWCGLAARAIQLRIMQYGVTPERFYTVVFVAIASAYALGYVAAVCWRRHGWLAGLRYVNTPLACGVALLALGVHTPLLDPLRWSVRSQYARLAEGRVDGETFDYAFLRFKLGHLGADALTALEQLLQHPQAELIRQRIAVARQLRGYWEAEKSRLIPLQAEDFIHIVPEHEPVAADLLAFLQEHLLAPWRQFCKTTGRCAIVAVNLDDDPDTEYVVLLADDSKHVSLLGYDRDAGFWRQLGGFHPVGAAPQDLETLLAALRQGGATAIVPRYRDVQIGTAVFSRQP